MRDKTVFRAGVISTVIAAICCFTPFLVLVLGAVGLSSWLGWLDYVLLPALGICVVILIYGFYRVRRGCGDASEEMS